MAHNLLNDTMAFVGEEPPWHGLGNPVSPNVSAAEMCGQAGLDWKVEKLPAPGARVVDKQKEIYDRYLIYRDPIGEEQAKVALGMVGSGYEPLQNRDAFTFFTPFIDSRFAQYETAGALGNGERVWVQAKLREQILVAKDDVVDRYLLLSNSHNGAGAVTIRFTPTRVVCQNTLNLAVEDGGKSAISVRHTRHIDRNLARSQASELKLIIDKVFADAQSLFAAMALRSLKPAERIDILEALFPRTKLQVAKKEKPERWRRVEAILEEDDVTPRMTAGSLWGLYNAVVRDEDYRPSREAGPEARLERVWFGASVDVKIRALDFCRKYVKKAA
jgi:phage/plasmid-like protein (TIGR03299 family)